MNTPPPDATSPEFFALQSAVAGRYSLVRELGRGGMGVVFLARDVALDRLVAIKLLPPTLAFSTELRARFMREARTAAGLSHPHIVPIHAVEEHGELAFFVMAWIDGETLGQRVRRDGPLPVRDAMRIIQEVAWALAHAHARRVVHRDVKPDNILLERESGRAMVTDFGIAHAATASGSGSGGGASGTPAYMSPEQAEGAPADPRSDLYALAATAFFALTGRPPYGGTGTSLMLQHATSDVPSLVQAAPRVPARLATIVEQSLAKLPSDRPENAEAVAAAIDMARGARGGQTPLPVRSFLHDVDTAGVEMSNAFTTAGVAGTLAAGTAMFTTGFDGAILSAIMVLVAAVGGSMGLVRGGQMMGRLRELRMQGYTHAALAPAAAEVEAEREEAESLAPELLARQRRDVRVLGSIGAVKTGAFMAIALASNTPAWLEIASIAGAVAVPTLTIRQIWRVYGSRRVFWSRFMAGSAGRMLSRVAGIGIGPVTPAALGSGEPTVLAIGADAEDVFNSLATIERERLAAVPDLIRQLKGDARRLIRTPEVPDAAARLATIAAALESLRLDLLRVRAGALTSEGLTSQLAIAADVRAEIDALLAAEAEVEQLLRAEEHTPV